MRKQKAGVQQEAVESINDSVAIGLEAQEKMEEIMTQGISDAFEAARSGLRQLRSASASVGAAMPLAAALLPVNDLVCGISEKNLESASSGTKAALGAYRRSVAEPLRKMVREQSARLAEKAGA